MLLVYRRWSVTDPWSPISKAQPPHGELQAAMDEQQMAARQIVIFTRIKDHMNSLYIAALVVQAQHPCSWHAARHQALNILPLVCCSPPSQSHRAGQVLTMKR
jgi:hypothetical protein